MRLCLLEENATKIYYSTISPNCLDNANFLIHHPISHGTWMTQKDKLRCWNPWYFLFCSLLWHRVVVPTRQPCLTGPYCNLWHSQLFPPVRDYELGLCLLSSFRASFKFNPSSVYRIPYVFLSLMYFQFIMSCSSFFSVGAQIFKIF
jgi:hypothetical protein